MNLLAIASTNTRLDFTGGLRVLVGLAVIIVGGLLMERHQ